MCDSCTNTPIDILAGRRFSARVSCVIIVRPVPHQSNWITVQTCRCRHIDVAIYWQRKKRTAAVSAVVPPPAPPLQCFFLSLFFFSCSFYFAVLRLFEVSHITLLPPMTIELKHKINQWYKQNIRIITNINPVFHFVFQIHLKSTKMISW